MNLMNRMLSGMSVNWPCVSRRNPLLLKKELIMHQFWAIFSFNNYTWHTKKVLNKIFSKFFQPFDSLSQVAIDMKRTARFLFCIVNIKLTQGLSGNSGCIVMFGRQTFQLNKRSEQRKGNH